MLLKHEIVGDFSKLRCVQVSDIPFIMKLRSDKGFTKFLGLIDNNVEKQKEWIIEQQKRFGDYYFIICDLDDTTLGTISLYDIENNCGFWGRWISKGSSLQNVEAVLLMHDFAFYKLCLDRVYSKVITENKRSLNFINNLGAKFVKPILPQDNIAVLFEFEITRDNYPKIREKNMNILISMRRKYNDSRRKTEGDI